MSPKPRGNDIDIEDGDATTIRLRLARNTSYYLITDAVSYLRSSALLIDTGVISSVTGTLRRIVDTAGNDLVPLDSDLTTNEREQLKLIEYDVNDDVIRFGASSSINEYTFAPVARAIEIGQSSPQALADPYIITLREGSFTIENDSDRTIERASGVDMALVPDLSNFQITKIGSTDQKDFVDYSKGAIIIQSSSPAVVSVVIDEVDIPQDNFDERMAGVPATTKDDFKSDASLQAIGASIFGNSFQGTWAAGTFAVGDVAWHSDRFYECTVARTASNTDNPATDTASWDVAQVTASGGGGGSLDQTTFNTRMANVPSATKDTYKAASVSFDQSTFDARMAAVPSATKDSYKSNVSILENTTHGLAALKTLLDAIPTDNPTVPTTAQIVTAIQAADFDATSGTQTLAQVLAAIKTVVDDIPSDVIDQTTFNTRMADVPSTTKNTYKATATAIIPDTDDNEQTTFNMRMFNVPQSTKNTYAFEAVGAVIFGSAYKGRWATGSFAVDDVVWYTNTVSGVSTSKFYVCTAAHTANANSDNPASNTSSWSVISPTTDRIISAMQSADFEDGSNTGTLAEVLAAIKTVVDAIPTSNPTVPTTTQIVTAMQAADFEDGDGTQTLAQVLAAIKDVVDDIPTTITFPDTSEDAGVIATEVIRQLNLEFEPTYDTLDAMLTAIKTAVDAIPTSDPPTTTDIANAVKDLEVIAETTSGANDEVNLLKNVKNTVIYYTW